MLAHCLDDLDLLCCPCWALYICQKCIKVKPVDCKEKKKNRKDEETHFVLIPLFLADVPRCSCMLPWGLGSLRGYMMVMNTSVRNGPGRKLKALTTRHSVS